MTWVMIILLIFVYLVIGGVIAALTGAEDDGDIFLLAAFWPIALLIVLFGAVGIIPVFVAKWLRSLFKRK